MVRPVMLAAGAVPAIVALVIAVPLLSKPDITFDDESVPEIEYTRQQMQKISHGVAERTGAISTEILRIDDSGQARYYSGDTQTARRVLDPETVSRLAALIRDTGFMTIPDGQYPVREDVTAYNRSSLKVTLGDITKQVSWPEPNATDRFVPPIITMVQSELDDIMAMTNK